MPNRHAFDWLFLFAMALVLVAFIAGVVQDAGGDSYSLVAVITTTGGLLVNIAAARFERMNAPVLGGGVNSWLAGLVTGGVLYVALNAIIFLVGVVLVGEEAQFAQRRLAFVSNRAAFGEYVLLSSSSVAAVFVAIVAVVAGATLVVRARGHLKATLVATAAYNGIALLIRLAALLRGDIAQFRVFADIGWGDVAIGLASNLAIISSMLWLGVVLARGRTR
jgi:hypothetical protein